MASVKFGGGVAEMRGAIGGVIFSSWRGIGIARKFTKPVSRISTTQPANRAWLGWLTRHFGTLSKANRDLWQVWADEHPGIDKFGDPFIMSGINAYVSLNLNAARVGSAAAVNDAPPLANLDQTIQGLTAAAGTNPGEIDVEWTLPNSGDAGDYIEIKQAGPFASPALTKKPPEMDYASKVAGDDLIQVVGSLVEEGWYWFAVRYTAIDGQTSNWHVAQSQPQVTP